jgi:hypothetical protein
MSEEAKVIDFPEEVRASFQFLIENYGFMDASSTSHKVRYESKKGFIEIGYGSYDCEVAIEFGRLGRDEKFSFTGFLRLVNPCLDKQMGDRIAYELDKVRTDLAALSKALQSEGQAILHGDDSVFEQMKDVRWWHFQLDALKKSSEHRPLE